jgi:Ribbon-helix-helix protein, copG family
MTSVVLSGERKVIPVRVVTFKIDDGLAARLDGIVRRRGLSKSEWLRGAIEARLAQEASGPSFADQARDLAGCVKGRPKDLSTNPKHLRRFGR